jgi:hypothetical protein
MSEVRLGIDVACRTDHGASLADDRGEFLWSSWRFRTTTVDLERLWAKIPDGARVTVMLEPTRNAWVPLAGWLQARGATVVLVPPEQSSDLRDYYNKYTKTDRLDSRVLARLPMLHPEGLRGIDDLGPAESLRRATRQRASMVKRRTAAGLRLDALVELLGPGWADTLGSGSYPKTSLVLLEKYADPRALKRLGRTRLAALLVRTSRGLWREDKADELLAMAAETISLWSGGGIDFSHLAEDIATEVRVLRNLRSTPSTCASKGSMPRPIPVESCARPRGSDRCRLPPSSAASGTSDASTTWPASAPLLDSCPRSTSQVWSQDTRESPRQGTPDCARRCSSPPTRPGGSTPPLRPAITGWSSPRASTTIRLSVRWPPS